MPTTVVAADECLTTRLERRANETCERLHQLCKGSDALAMELAEKFLAAVADVERITIESIAQGSGAFLVENGTVRFDEEPVAKLLEFVIKDVAGQSEGGHTLAPEEIPDLLEKVFVTYVLHELRHRTQGVQKYSAVRELKNIAGQGAMAEFDVLADRDAVYAFAAVENSSGSRIDFLSAFREGLFLSTAYFFRVFKPTPDRPDKLARVIGVLLMAARLSGRDLSEPVVERDDLRLDAPLMVKLSTGRNQLAIYKAEPSKRLLAVAKDEAGDNVSGLVADVEQGCFDAALTKSVALMGRLRLL